MLLWLAGLGLSEEVAALLLLDLWCHHRCAQFRNWVKDNYPWIKLVSIPGGCTGKVQPADVGLNHPMKVSCCSPTWFTSCCCNWWVCRLKAWPALLTGWHTFAPLPSPPPQS